MRNLVLDTCALLWLAAGSSRLSGAALKTIDNASITYVSAISAWEISLKVARDKLRLPLPPQEWFDSALAQHNLLVAPLDLDVLFSASQLPRHHRDPADRFVIATALKNDAAIVTGDQKISMYDVRTIC